MDRSPVQYLVLIIICTPIITVAFHDTVLDKANAQTSGNKEIEDLIFDHQRLYKESDLLFRAAFGDLIPGNDLNEMAVCSRNGRITVTYGSDMSWNTDLVKHVYINDVPTDPAEVYSLAAGDIIPEREGDELISADMDYSVRLYGFDNGKWNSEVIWEGTDWLYEVAIAEIVENNQGPEIVVVGEEQRAFLLTRNGDTWESELLFKDNFAIDTCFADDLLPENPGMEIVVGGIDRNVTLITGSPGNWTAKDIAFIGHSVIDLVILDLDPTIPGKEIYASDFNGDVHQIYPNGDGFLKRIVHSEGRMVYGLEMGEIEGRPVISMASYNNRIALLYFENGFKVKELYREDFIMMGTGIHDLDPYHKGNEVFALSGLGYLTMIYHDDPGVDVILPFDSTTLSLNESIEVPFIVRSKGGYDGNIDFTPSVSGSSVSLPAAPTIGSTGLYSYRFPGFSQPGSYELEFGLEGSAGKVKKSVTALVVNDLRPVNFSKSILEGSVGRDRQRSFDFRVLSETDVGSPFVLSPYRLPTGIELAFNRSAVDPLGSPISISSTVKVQPGTDLMKHHFFLLGSSSDSRKRAVGFSIEVKKSSVADFDIFMEESSLEIGQGEEIKTMVTVISTNGFSESVNISVVEVIDDLETSFSQREVVPPAEIELSIRALMNDGPYFILIQGTSGDMVRQDTIRIDTTPPEISLKISGAGKPLELENDREGGLVGALDLELFPENGTIESVSLEIQGLEEGYSVILDPANIPRIPYTIPLEIMVFAPRNGTLESIILNFSSEDGFWTQRIMLSYPEPEEDENSGIPATWIGIAVLTLLLVAGIIVVLYPRMSNPLNRNEGSSDKHAGGRGPRNSVETVERSSGGSRGLDRMGGGRK